MRNTGALGVVACLFFVQGCAPTLSAESIKQMQPARSAEMDHLGVFVGRWETTAENKVICLNQTFPILGSTDNAWEADGWYLVERGQYEMGELGTVHEVGVWTYDSSAKTFRTWRFDSFGGERVGTADFDPGSRTWTIRARRSSPWGSTLDRGTIKVVDDKTLEWVWSEWLSWDVLHLFKIAEFKGTSRRL